jgi:hypothetical protein
VRYALAKESCPILLISIESFWTSGQTTAQSKRIKHSNSKDDAFMGALLGVAAKGRNGDGNPSYGASASNSNINAALKMVGIGAFLPTGGDTGDYVYLDVKTKEVSGFAVSLKWTIGGGR